MEIQYIRLKQDLLTKTGLTGSVFEISVMLSRQYCTADQDLMLFINFDKTLNNTEM